MSMSKKTLGTMGEDIAFGYLIQNGYTILTRNYRNTLGEVDIIAKDNNTLCFIEVKARTTEDFGSPFEAVSRSKQRQIIRVATWYLQENQLKDISVRFDVIGIVFGNSTDLKIDLIKNAFDCDI